MVSCWWFKCVKGQRKEIKGGIKGIKERKTRKKSQKNVIAFLGGVDGIPVDFFFSFFPRSLDTLTLAGSQSRGRDPTNLPDSICRSLMSYRVEGRR